MASTGGLLHLGRGALGRRFAVLGIVLGLAACNTVSPETPKAAADPFGPTVAAPPEATQPSVPLVAAAEASFRFDQILGVPALKQDTLARAIATSAGQRSIRLVRRNDPNAPYRVLGYLSAAGGDAGVAVTYVWDVVDAQNVRVHRVTGIEIAGAASADPWSSVNDQVLQAIAARTVEGIYAWINRLPPPADAPVKPGAPAGAAAPQAPRLL